MTQAAIRHSVRPPVCKDAISRVSNQLTDTYRLLEKRADELQQQLAIANQARSKQAHENARLAKQLKQLINALPAGVVVLDGRGSIRDCNTVACALLGCQLLGLEWRDVIQKTFVPVAEEEHEARLRDGRLVSISTCPLGDEPGQIILLNDVTVTRRMQEHVNRQRRLLAMGEMAAALAHQIRTPLASALLYAAHLNRSDLEENKRQHLVVRFIRRLRDLEQMVTDMLMFAKGGGQAKEHLAVRDLFNDLQARLASRLAESACQLLLRVDTPQLKVCANRSAILNVLQNLASNAIEACAGNGDIVVAARAVPGSGHSQAIEFSVKDDGIGISKEDMERIFEPFFTTRSQGTGLGLAVVRAVIEAHNGTIAIESQHRVGTTVTIRLPVSMGDVDKGTTLREGL